MLHLVKPYSVLVLQSHLLAKINGLGLGVRVRAVWGQSFHFFYGVTKCAYGGQFRLCWFGSLLWIYMNVE